MSEAPKETSPQEALASLREFLSGLEPEDKIQISDCEGNIHTLRTNLPARQHIRVMRRLDEVVAQVDSDDVPGKGLKKFTGILRKAIRNEAAVEGLGQIFTEAYPDAVKAAGGGNALDLFPLDSILEGVIPLLSRLLAKALAMADRKTSQKKTLSTT